MLQCLLIRSWTAPMGQSERHSTEHTNRIESRIEHGEKYRRIGGMKRYEY